MNTAGRNLNHFLINRGARKSTYGRLEKYRLPLKAPIETHGLSCASLVRRTLQAGFFEVSLC